MDVIIEAKGHPNIRATHQTTWQLTTEKHLTPRGDCIIAVNASHAAKDLPKEIKHHLQQGGKVKIVIMTNNIQYSGIGKGHPDLNFTHQTDMVFRRSNYTCERTITINTSFTSKDLPREFVEQAQDSSTKISIKLTPITQNVDDLS